MYVVVRTEVFYVPSQTSKLNCPEHCLFTTRGPQGNGRADSAPGCLEQPTNREQAGEEGEGVRFRRSLG